MPPEYNSVVPSFEEELQKLRGEYWKHQCSMGLLDAVKPINPLPVQEQIVLKKHRNQHGRSYLWVLSQERCAAGGECCGCVCSCCEKALNQYLSPGKDLVQETKEDKVLGHCTVECRCCIGHRGCYIPDSCLPAGVIERLYRETTARLLFSSFANINNNYHYNSKDTSKTMSINIDSKTVAIIFLFVVLVILAKTFFEILILAILSR